MVRDYSSKKMGKITFYRISVTTQTKAHPDMTSRMMILEIAEE